MATTDDTTNITTTDNVDTSCDVKTDTVETTSSASVDEPSVAYDAEEYVETEVEQEDEQEVEDDDESVFVIRVNDRNHGWTYTRSAAEAAADVLATILGTRDMSSYHTYTCKKDEEIRIYGRYRFYFLSYERLLYTISIDEIARLTFAD